ncbi:unnamed protein product [Paramecium sonneborni]|uniref:Uncharacterized protein n=1 Tax=Paramecium sonneborni TaxID=65129 RepID=A0A8S1RVJ0_9CILI|nr:unnamed protein product [Paramecium sonneborni]
MNKYLFEILNQQPIRYLERRRNFKCWWVVQKNQMKTLNQRMQKVRFVEGFDRELLESSSSIRKRQIQQQFMNRKMEICFKRIENIQFNQILQNQKAQKMENGQSYFLTFSQKIKSSIQQKDNLMKNCSGRGQYEKKQFEERNLNRIE